MLMPSQAVNMIQQLAPAWLRLHLCCSLFQTKTQVLTVPLALLMMQMAAELPGMTMPIVDGMLRLTTIAGAVTVGAM
jgi:hypothetical protein